MEGSSSAVGLASRILQRERDIHTSTAQDSGRDSERFSLFELGVAMGHVLAEGAEVCLADGADGVEVSAGAVVLGHVASQSLVHVGRGQHQEGAPTTPRPWQQLGKQVGQDKPVPGLHVLQSYVLSLRAPVDLELWDEFGSRSNSCYGGVDHVVNADRDV